MTDHARIASAHIASARLQQQRIVGSALRTPEDVVSWLLAVQAQDFSGSLWAVGLRLPGAGVADIESAINDARLVRTWPMRGTLHLLAAADVRWMLDLLATRTIASSAGRLERDYALDAATLKRCRKIVEKHLRDGPQRRSSLYESLGAAGITTDSQRGINLLGRLSQEGLICGGPRDGKQPTFALLDAWLPETKRLHRDEALAELARRYFASRGPATVQDLAWWSGLTQKDVRIAIDLAMPHLLQETIDGTVYWRSPDTVAVEGAAEKAYLLPPFDEYMVAYRDRSVPLDPAYGRRVIGINGLFNPAIVIDGKVVGTWKRSFKKDAASIALDPFKPLARASLSAVRAAAKRYGAFLGSPVVVA